MKKSSSNRQSGDDDDDDMFLYVAATEKLACQSRRMAKEQDTAENCFSGKFDNEVQIFFLKTSKNKSVGFAEQHEPRPIRGSSAHYHKGIRWYSLVTANIVPMMPYLHLRKDLRRDEGLWYMYYIEGKMTALH